MTELDKLTASCIVQDALPCGIRDADRVMEIIDLHWLDTPPFMAPNRPRFEITLRNHYGTIYNEHWSGKEKCTVGIWPMFWWGEGGWSDCPIAPCSTETFESDGMKIPAEQGIVGGTLHIGQTLGHPAQYLAGLDIWTLQNPDALDPAQSPPSPGPGHFPIPHSPYSVVPGSGFHFDSIALPSLSRSHAVAGEIVVRLLSPKDYTEWADRIGRWSLTEFRISGVIDLSDDYGDLSYEYSFYVGHNWYDMRKLKPFASVALTKADNSASRTLPFTFPRSYLAMGTQVPVYFGVDIFIQGANVSRVNGSHPMFFSPDISRYHRFVQVGYSIVGS